MEEKQQLNVTELSDMDLVNGINQTEGLAWRMNHDAADGRISEEGVDESISELHTTRDKLVAELKKRTGLESHGDLRKYMGMKLKEQDNMWDRQWEEIYQPGAVFSIFYRGKPVENSEVFETIRTYLPLRGTSGPKQHILTRVHGNEYGTGQFRIFDDRDVVKMQKLNILPKYNKPSIRGVVRIDEELEKRIELDSGNRNWTDFCDAGSVFSHVGFNNIFETYGLFNLPNVEQKEDNEVIIARPHPHDHKFYEFIKKDLGAMTIIPMKPKYHKSKRHAWFRSANLYVEHVI